MTVMAERTAQMSVEEFEKIAAFSARETEAVRLEFIDGRIGIKCVTDGQRGALVMWLIRQCMRARPNWTSTPLRG